MSSPRLPLGREAQTLIAVASEHAEVKKKSPATAHLLLAMMQESGTAKLILQNRGISMKALKKTVSEADSEDGRIFNDMLREASRISRQLRGREIGGVHLLAALASLPGSSADLVLKKLECDPISLRNAAIGSLTGRGMKWVGTREPDTTDKYTAAANQGEGRMPLPSHSARRAANASPPAPLPEQPGTRRPALFKDPAKKKNTNRAVTRPEPFLKLRKKAERADSEAHETPASPEPEKKLREKSAPGVTPVVKQEKAQAECADFEIDPEKTPVLFSLGMNLADAAALGEIDPLIGRKEELERLTDVLLKRRANNPLIVGEPGVGKTAIVQGLALSIAKGRMNALKDRIIMQISGGDLLSGTQLRGALSEKLGALKKEVEEADGRIVLFIDEIHSLFSGTDGSSDVAQELKQVLAQGGLPLIGTTTPAEMKQFMENDPAFLRRFTMIEIDEPSEEEAVEIISGIIKAYEEHHGVSISSEALESAVSLTSRYIQDRALPDKALSLLDLVAAGCRRDGRDIVTVDDISRALAKEIGVPARRILASEQKRLLELEQVLSERIVGQKEVLSTLSEVLRRNAVGFRGKRPIGSFMFLGPTGVGKTETAKVLSEVLFPGTGGLLRFDMSEMSEAHATARLIGSPPGYVGHEDGGQLTEAVRKRPYSLVLLDEIEKAHRDVMQLLLGLLDDGRLTDGRGKTVDFSNTIIIMTSNLGHGSRKTARTLGFGADDTTNATAERRSGILERARAALPVELWNRIDEPIVFDPLSMKDAAEVGSKMLAEVASKLSGEQGVTVEHTPETVQFLLDHGGYDPELGARPMRRTIQRYVEAPLAGLILKGEIKKGDTALISPDDEAGLSISLKS